VDRSTGGVLYPDHYVALAAQRDITRGTSAGTFNPFDSITRAQIMTMAVRGAAGAGIPLQDPSAAYYAGTNQGTHIFRGFDDPLHGAGVAWSQYFRYGGRLYGVKGSCFRVRAAWAF